MNNNSKIYLYNVPKTHPVFQVPYPKWHDTNWIHKRVMGLFGKLSDGASPRKTASILYRHEPQSGRVLVQATETLRPKYQETVSSVELSDTLNSLRGGDVLRIRLAVNAAKTVNVQGKPTRIVVPVEDQVVWVESKIPGLAVNAVLDADRDTLRMRKVPLVVLTVDVTGTIINPALFTNAVRNGVGRAKAYGCGLISIAPA